MNRVVENLEMLFGSAFECDQQGKKLNTVRNFKKIRKKNQQNIRKLPSTFIYES